MLFLVVGTPWKTPRSSRLCCPDCGDGWFGGISSTRTATLRMRLRNLWERVERLLDYLYLDEMFTLPTEINKALTPSSRRRLCCHHRYRLCPRPVRPLRLLPR